MTRPWPEFLTHSPSHVWSSTGKGCSPLRGYDCASCLPVLALQFPLLASFPFSPNLSGSYLSHQAQVKACFFQAVLPKPELLPPSQALSQDFLLLSGLDWKHFCIPYQREPPTGLRAMLAGVWLWDLPCRWVTINVCDSRDLQKRTSAPWKQSTWGLGVNLNSSHNDLWTCWKSESQGDLSHHSGSKHSDSIGIYKCRYRPSTKGEHLLGLCLRGCLREWNGTGKDACHLSYFFFLRIKCA